MSMRSYSGDPIDDTYQYISERPSLEDEADDIVYATDPSGGGEESAENVPVPDEPDDNGPVRPIVKGQTTIREWCNL